jgi:hypothetical protein
MLSAPTITAPTLIGQAAAAARTDETRARSDVRVIHVLATATLALACAWLLAFNLVDPDLWGHVRYGQDWLAAGELPRTATHTFTAVGHPWINHENLAELALAWSYETLGVTGMLAAKCVFGMTIILAMVWTATRRGVHPFVAWPLMLLIAFNLQPFFILRPQLFSFAFCAVVLVLLDQGFREWHEHRKIDARYLWCLPAVFIVWANSHGGFVAGLAIVGAYLGGRIVELQGLVSIRNPPPRYSGEGLGEGFLEMHINIKSRLSQPQNTDGQASSGTPSSDKVLLAQLTVIGFGCIAATLLNPYGWKLHRWLFVSLIEPRPEITEWFAPQMSDPTFWPWIGLLAVIAVSLFATRERRDWVEIVILLLVVWQSTLHLRHIAFVAIVAGFWLPVHFQSALSRFRRVPLLAQTKRIKAAVSSKLGRLSHFTTVSALLAAITLQTFALEKRLTTFPVDRDRYPIDAIQFMADRQLEGKLVVAFNWAQYTLAALSPRITVGFDGRYDTCYPLEVVDMHFDFLLGEFGGSRHRRANAGPIDPTQILNHEKPDLVLIDRHYKNAVATMKTEATQSNPEWILLYCDRVAELWGRASRYDDSRSPDFIAARQRVLDASPREGSIAWPALPLSLPKQPTDAKSIAVQN